MLKSERLILKKPELEDVEKIILDIMLIQFVFLIILMNVIKETDICMKV